jgi:hypothetical protein
VLLPRLREIQISLHIPIISASVPFFQSLIGPDLTSIQIDLRLDVDADYSLTTSHLYRILSYLSRLCHGIHILRFSSIACPPEGTAAAMVSDLICTLNLRNFFFCHSNQLSEQALRHLGDLPRLKTLGILDISQYRLLLFTTSQNRFQAHTEFDFEAADWTVAAAVMRLCVATSPVCL